MHTFIFSATVGSLHWYVSTLFDSAAIQSFSLQSTTNKNNSGSIGVSTMRQAADDERRNHCAAFLKHLELQIEKIHEQHQRSSKRRSSIVASSHRSLSQVNNNGFFLLLSLFECCVYEAVSLCIICTLLSHLALICVHLSLSISLLIFHSICVHMCVSRYA